MGSVPYFKDLRGFGGVCEDKGGFGCRPSSSSSLVLDEERGELVKASLGRVGRKGGRGGVQNAKAAVALKSHSEAERRRRERINGHLATLRSMVPRSDKLDKAALLAQVISHVKKLKNNALEISRGLSIPSDADEVSVEAADEDKSNAESFAIRVSLCCEDRPDIHADLRQTFRSLQLRILRAEICTLGGRMKNVFVTACEGRPDDGGQHRFAANVKEALKAALDRANLPEFTPRTSSDGGKRPRISPFESSRSSSRSIHASCSSSRSIHVDVIGESFSSVKVHQPK